MKTYRDLDRHPMTALGWKELLLFWGSVALGLGFLGALIYYAL